MRDHLPPWQRSTLQNMQGFEQSPNLQNIPSLLHGAPRAAPGSAGQPSAPSAPSAGASAGASAPSTDASGKLESPGTASACESPEASMGALLSVPESAEGVVELHATKTAASRTARVAFVLI